MEKIAKKKKNYANMSIEVISRTVEYNDILLVKMVEIPENRRKTFQADQVNKYSDEVADKKVIFIIHGLNTEGIQDVPALYKQEYFETLIEYYMDHVDKFDIYFIPLANPDGAAQLSVVKLVIL